MTANVATIGEKACNKSVIEFPISTLLVKINGTQVNVGSGFSDSDRDNYWAGRDSVVGTVVEVRADAITQNQDGTYSLRFPRFLKFRGFEAGEKI